MHPLHAIHDQTLAIIINYYNLSAAEIKLKKLPAQGNDEKREVKILCMYTDHMYNDYYYFPAINNLP